MSTIDEYLKKLQKETAANTQAKVDAINNSAAASAQIIRDETAANIKETEQSYNDLFDQNNVQRIINERRIAENMANMGLTDSGLNRTQMTANQLSYANQQNKLTAARQKAVDDLARVMNSQLASLEAERASKEASIRTADYDNNYSQAVSMYKADQKAYADAISNQQKSAQDSYDKVWSVMGGSGTAAFKQQYLADYARRNGMTLAEAYAIFGDPTRYVKTDDGGDSTENDIAETYYNDITSVLESYHKANEYIDEKKVPHLEQDPAFASFLESKGWLVPSGTSASGQMEYSLTTEGKAFEDAVLRRTEGTRKFWLNPHVDGPLTYTAVTDETDLKTKTKNSNGIYMDAYIQDQYGNKWALSDVLEASKRALAKAQFGNKWQDHINDTQIKKDAAVQTKKVQKKVFG